jgi:uncharacterized C2H2 Zn-finger protein
MSLDEKKVLAYNLSCLSEAGLKTALRYLRDDWNVTAAPLESNLVELDLNALSDAQLWKLSRLVSHCVYLTPTSVPSTTCLNCECAHRTAEQKQKNEKKENEEEDHDEFASSGRFDDFGFGFDDISSTSSSHMFDDSEGNENENENENDDDDDDECSLLLVRDSRDLDVVSESGRYCGCSCHCPSSMFDEVDGGINDEYVDGDVKGKGPLKTVGNTLASNALGGTASSATQALTRNSQRIGQLDGVSRPSTPTTLPLESLVDNALRAQTASDGDDDLSLLGDSGDDLVSFGRQSSFGDDDDDDDDDDGDDDLMRFGSAIKRKRSRSNTSLHDADFHGIDGDESDDAIKRQCTYGLDASLAHLVDEPLFSIERIEDVPRNPAIHAFVHEFNDPMNFVVDGSNSNDDFLAASEAANSAARAAAALYTANGSPTHTHSSPPPPPSSPLDPWLGIAGGSATALPWLPQFPTDAIVAGQQQQQEEEQVRRGEQGIVPPPLLRQRRRGDDKYGKDDDGNDDDDEQDDEQDGDRFSIKVHIYSLAKHSNDPKRPFLCDACGKTFRDRSNLMRHVRTHTHEKPYVCSWPGCPKRFSHAAGLRDHVNTHTGERPYACPDCPKRFANQANCRRHRLLHTGEKHFHCERCGASFFQKANLKSHVARHEKKDAKNKSKAK